MIPFNKPHLTGQELPYIQKASALGHLSGNGAYTKNCQKFLTARIGCHHTLLTTSCTDALEMSAFLLNIQPGDEVIVPSFTFVSSANPYVIRGATIRFIDSSPDHPNMDASKIEEALTPKTKAIVAVHYAGHACDMKRIMEIAKAHRLPVVEDAAQAIDSFYRGRPLGSFGDFATFSFHETKNIIAGEGGALAINRADATSRAEILWEKGTNRSQFFRGEVDKYGWVDVGSSFLPSEVTAAFLLAQLENMDLIQTRRKSIWDRYLGNLSVLEQSGKVRVPRLPEGATNNGHLFYLIHRSLQERTQFIEFLKQRGAHAVFHYQSLHKSPFYRDRHDGRELPWSDYYSDRLTRLPLFYDLTDAQIDEISQMAIDFYRAR